MLNGRSDNLRADNGLQAVYQLQSEVGGRLDVQTISEIENETINSKEGQAFSLWYAENYDAIIADVKVAAGEAEIALPTE